LRWAHVGEHRWPERLDGPALGHLEREANRGQRLVAGWCQPHGGGRPAAHVQPTRGMDDNLAGSWRLVDHIGLLQWQIRERRGVPDVDLVVAEALRPAFRCLVPPPGVPRSDREVDPGGTARSQQHLMETDQLTRWLVCLRGIAKVELDDVRAGGVPDIRD